MRFEVSKKSQNLGKNVGFLFSYMIFTFIVYLLFFRKYPSISRGVLYAVISTIIVIIIGLAVTRMLK